MFCYHHNDMDGKAAGWIVHKWATENHIESENVKNYAMMTYNDKFNRHPKGCDIVFIVDLSFTESTYDQLKYVCNTAKLVIWIDHHTSSVDLVKRHRTELNNFHNLIRVISDTGCGAVLTRLFCMFSEDDIYNQILPHKNEIIISDDNYTKDSESKDRYYSLSIENNNDDGFVDFMSRSIRVKYNTALYMIDDHDRWIHQNPNTKNFILGTDAEYTGVISTTYKGTGKVIGWNRAFWDTLDLMFNTDLPIKTNEYITAGITISKYQTSVYRRQMVNSFEIVVDGISILCKNGMGNSTNFLERYDRYNAVILFWYNGKDDVWQYSIYSNNKKFDCKAFAEYFGGGGHTGAAGFTSPGDKAPLFKKNGTYSYRS